jgi:hypothetical protein
MKYLLAGLATAASVSAHGWVDNATIGGQFYQASSQPLTL